MPSTFANGKIWYTEMPAADIGCRWVLQKGLPWNIRKRGDGSVAFDDTTGEVSGTWVLGRPASRTASLLLYIVVDSVVATLDAIVANGGQIVQPIGADAPEITARFRDLSGNVIGLDQQPV